MFLVNTEKAIVDQDDSSIFYVKNDIYSIVTVSLNWKQEDIPYFKWRKIVFPYEVPCEVDVYVTYIADDWLCWECLTREAMIKKFYRELFWTDDDSYIEWYDKDSVIEYLKEALVIIRNIKADTKTLRQYSLSIWNVLRVSSSCNDKCEQTYRDIDMIPKEWKALTNKWLFIDYQVVKDKVIFDKSFNVDTSYTIFWYKLPKLWTILNIKLDWQKIDFKEYQGYYFFWDVSWTVTIEYYSDIRLNECCVEFDESFWRLPVLYALFNTMYTRWDERAQRTEKRYNDLLKEYQKYIRKNSLKDVNWNKPIIPRKRYHRFVVR